MNDFLLSSQLQWSRERLEMLEARNRVVASSQYIAPEGSTINSNGFQDDEELALVDEVQRFRIGTGDEEVDEVLVDDTSDIDEQDDGPCGGYMPTADDRDTDEDGGGSSGTSHDVVMV